MSNEAMRKRVSRIEKRMDKGMAVSPAERAVVAQWRKTHKRYKTGVPATVALTISDDEAMRIQLEMEGEGAQPDESSTSDASSADETDVPVEGVGQVTTDTPPTLGQFASEVMDVATSKAGVCPVEGCGAPITDGQYRCGRCGAIVRPDLCPKCRTPFVDGDAFCRVDGQPRPVAAAAKVVTNSAGQPVLEKEVIRMWDKRNTAWLMTVIDMGLKRGGMDPMDDDERKSLVDALVPVLNKRLPASGRFAEEIRLGVVAAGIFLPRAYIALVIVPERKAAERRKEEIHRAQLAAIGQAAPVVERPAVVEVPMPKAGA